MNYPTRTEVSTDQPPVTEHDTTTANSQSVDKMLRHLYDTIEAMRTTNKEDLDQEFNKSNNTTVLTEGEKNRLFFPDLLYATLAVASLLTLAILVLFAYLCYRRRRPVPRQDSRLGDISLNPIYRRSQDSDMDYSTLGARPKDRHNQKDEKVMIFHVNPANPAAIMRELLDLKADVKAAANSAMETMRKEAKQMGDQSYTKMAGAAKPDYQQMA